MSSTPLRNSDFSSETACRARSKLSRTGSNALTASASAYSRNSCCSRVVRLRVFSNSACSRARRSSSVSRSAFSFSSSVSRAVTPPAGRETSAVLSAFLKSSPVSSDPGSSCSVSSSRGSISDFPFVLAIRLSLRFVQNLVKKTCDVGHSSHRVLVIDAGRTDHGERPHYFAAHARRRPDQHEVAHRRQRLIQADHHTYCFLLGIEIGSQ